MKNSEQEYYLCDEDLKMPGGTIVFKKGNSYKRSMNIKSQLELINEQGAHHTITRWIKHFTKTESK